MAKNWCGRTSNSWATATNWIGGVAPIANDDVNMLSSDLMYAATINITAITKAAQAVVTCSAHTFVAGDTVYILGVTGMTQINGLRVVASTADNTHITLTVNSSAFGTYTGPSGTGQPYATTCYAGPASPITIASLTVTLAANQNNFSILNSNGQNVRVSTSFTATDPGGASTTANNNIGTPTVGQRPILLSGCTGSILAAPNAMSSAYRSWYVDVNEGATLTFSVDPNAPTGAVGSSGASFGGNVAGTLTVPDTSSPEYQVNPLCDLTSSTGIINLNHSSVFALSFVSSGGGTINVNAEIALVPSGTTFWNGNGLAINANAALLVHNASSNSVIRDDTTINAAAPVGLSNFGIASGKTLSVIVTGGHEVVPYDVTGPGTLSITGTASIAAQYAADQAAVRLKETNIEMGQTVLGVAGKLPVKVFEV